MSQNVELLVHIGPLREESETLLKHVNQVTLLAPLFPMPDRQQVLAKNLPALHITEQPVTPPGGEAVCYAYTLKDFNSLAPASELTSLYPGLGKARHQTVDTQTLPQALEQAGLSQATLTHLIIEQPEIALSLLKAFNHSGLLDQLTHLWVRTSPLSLYEGMATNVELAQWCEQHGFEIGVQDAEDPDFFLIELTRNPLYSKLQAVQEQLAEHETQFSHLSAERDTLKKALAETEQNSKQYAQKAQQQLEEKATQLKDKDAQLGERASQLEQLSTERDKLKKTLAEAEQNSKQSAQKAQQQLKEKDAQLGERASQLKQLTEERDALKKTLAETQQNSKQSAEKSQQQLEEKTTQLKEKDAELAERDTQLSQLTEERDALKKQLSQAIKVSQQHQKEHQESEQRLKDVTQKYEAVEQQLQNAEQAGQKVQKKLEETHTWFMNRKQQAEEGAEENKALQERLKMQQAQVESLQEKLTTSEEEREHFFANRKKQHEEAETKLTEAQQQLTEKEAMISQLSEQLATLQHSNERFGQLESKLESLFGEQRSYIQQTTNALGQHVTRSARQQRDEQALTHYLQHGQRPVSTQLAPGYAMALLEHYDTHHHDVVVIFGSLNTTELLAQSIINARTEQPQLIRQNGQRQEKHNEVTLSHDDLPQTIVSIQHQKTVSDELKERLNNKRLSHAVNVVYAPWGECQANDQIALFYAAETTLQRLNQWLTEDARVLIIVGETLPEAGHSREVALPLLLKQLPTQRLDIVLESNSYPQEGELTTRWDSLLETRQRPAQWLALPNAYSLRVE